MLNFYIYILNHISVDLKIIELQTIRLVKSECFILVVIAS